MSKVAHYLQEHVIGEVVTSTDARRYFAHDASVLQLAPTLIVYPRNENDVRKTARFSWQLAERGRIIPITARGSGTDQSGAALSSGIMVVFPAHMNRILELDTKAHTVTVEPGLILPSCSRHCILMAGLCRLTQLQLNTRQLVALSATTPRVRNPLNMVTPAISYKV